MNYIGCIEASSSYSYTESVGVIKLFWPTFHDAFKNNKRATFTWEKEGKWAKNVGAQVVVFTTKLLPSFSQSHISAPL